MTWLSLRLSPCLLSSETSSLFKEVPSTCPLVEVLPPGHGVAHSISPKDFLCTLLSANGLLFPGSLVLWLSASSTVRRLEKRRGQGKLVSCNSWPFPSCWVQGAVAEFLYIWPMSFGHSSFWVSVSPSLPQPFWDCKW